MDHLIRKRSSMKAKLTSFSNYLEILDSCTSLSDLQATELQGRLSKIESLYDEFDQLQVEIELLSEDTDEAFAAREAFEQAYHRLVATGRCFLTRHERKLLESAGGFGSGSKDTVQQTSMVKVINEKGKKYAARLLLDNGSTVHFVSSSFCNKLGLTRRGTYFTVIGVNNQTSFSSQSCNLHIESYYGEYSFNISCLILPQITQILPSTPIDISKIPIPTGIQLADPSFYIPSVIDVLVGAEVFWDVILSNRVNLGKNLPILCESRLGWLISGSIGARKSLSYNNNSCDSKNLICNFSQSEINMDLAKFWELDLISSTHSLSTEERACEDSFYKHTLRSDEGHFIVKMPLKLDPSVLGKSYEMAKHRLFSLEKRFQRDQSFKSIYLDFMREYLEIGHMSLNTDNDHNDGIVKYYFLHHGVLRESSTTGRLKRRQACRSTTYRWSDPPCRTIFFQF